MSKQIYAIHNDGMWWVWDRTTFTFRLIDTEGETAFAISYELVHSSDWSFMRDYLNRKYRQLRIPSNLQGIQFR